MDNVDAKIPCKDSDMICNLYMHNLRICRGISLHSGEEGDVAAGFMTMTGYVTVRVSITETEFMI
jgi:hypothetical protein